jgi:hemolysin activation/secretion protein
MEVAQYVHIPISETDLGEIEERVEALYKEKGYKRVGVFIPPKQKKGVLTIHIDESSLRSKADPT